MADSQTVIVCEVLGVFGLYSALTDVRTRAQWRSFIRAATESRGDVDLRDRRWKRLAPALSEGLAKEMLLALFLVEAGRPALARKLPLRTGGIGTCVALSCASAIGLLLSGVAILSSCLITSAVFFVSGLATSWVRSGIRLHYLKGLSRAGLWCEAAMDLAECGLDSVQLRWLKQELERT